MTTLPYVATPGNVTKALNAIQNAATPDKVTQDFVKTVLKIPGGSGNQMTTFLKRVGFVASDGIPTAIYKKFRNSATAGLAAAEAIRSGYSELYRRNEYMHALSDRELKGLVVEATGNAPESRSVALTVSTIQKLKEFADFQAQEPAKSDLPARLPPHSAHEERPPPLELPPSGLGLNLGYTINLNLPATTDINVFNAIFKSLRDNLLRDDG
jgi:hypothetical protein